MEIRILNYLLGYLRISIIGNSYDRFLNLCAHRNIVLWDIRPCHDYYECCISVRDYKKLREIVRKSHTSIRIEKKNGFPFYLHKYRKRIFGCISIMAALLLMHWLSLHIWNISIDGNLSQSDDVILEYLTANGYVHGMMKKKVDCQKLSAELRNYFTDFSWTAAELKGTRLLIHIREGILREEEETQSEEASSLIAAKSGEILSIFVRSGRPLVKPGDTVEKGQRLVSGLLPIYSDDGTLVKTEEVSSDADIMLKTSRQYRDSLPLLAEERQYTGQSSHSWALRLGDRLFAFPVIQKNYENSDFVTEITQLHLTENFYLPVYYEKYTQREYEIQKKTLTKEEARIILNNNFQYFMINLEEKGVQIFENDVKIEWNAKSAIASGTIITGENAVRSVHIDRTEEELPENEYG